jgi:hypothetical protein
VRGDRQGVGGVEDLGDLQAGGADGELDRGVAHVEPARCSVRPRKPCSSHRGRGSADRVPDRAGGGSRDRVQAMTYAYTHGYATPS